MNKNPYYEPVAFHESDKLKYYIEFVPHFSNELILMKYAIAFPDKRHKVFHKIQNPYMLYLWYEHFERDKADVLCKICGIIKDFISQYKNEEAQYAFYQLCCMINTN